MSDSESNSDVSKSSENPQSNNREDPLLINESDKESVVKDQIEVKKGIKDSKTIYLIIGIVLISSTIALSMGIFIGFFSTSLYFSSNKFFTSVGTVAINTTMACAQDVHVNFDTKTTRIPGEPFMIFEDIERYQCVGRCVECDNPLNYKSSCWTSAINTGDARFHCEKDVQSSCESYGCKKSFLDECQIF